MTALPSLSNELAAAVEQVAGSVVAVNARPRLPSTGVHWRPGIIVTADHTVRSVEDLTVVDREGRTMAATLVGRDPGTDLAVLRIQDTALPTAGLGDSSSLKVGHIVLAVGYGPRASWGIVSAVGGRWRTWRGGEIDQLLRLDLTLYPGFSGGPIVDAQGRIAGINTSGLSQRLELAIPASTVSRVADELIEKGHVSRAFLGVGLQPARLPEAARRALAGAPEIGLIVVRVQPEGPAAQAGILLGDVLVSLEGISVASPEAVLEAVAARRVGSTVSATILRAGTPTVVSVTLGERPLRRR
jgi:S1-C subfamily serine protease